MTNTKNGNGHTADDDNPTFDAFVAEVEALLGHGAEAKNYSSNGPNGHNALYRAVQSMTNDTHAHACGEIVYKVQRFLSTGQRGNDVTDILKVAAWAFLIWRHHKLDEN